MRIHRKTYIKIAKKIERISVVLLSLIFAFQPLIFAGVADAAITNGQNAMFVLGQYEDDRTTTLTPLFTTKLEPDNAPSAMGLDNPRGLEIDAENHRLFVSDNSNSRVLVFNLNATDQIADYRPDYVLGKGNFYESGTGTASQTRLDNPRDVVYDAANDRLFVAGTEDNRVMVFDLSSGITNGMNAQYVLGQPNFTTGTTGVTQAKMNAPTGLALDAARNRLFVSESGNNRVLAFDTASLATGMSASNVLGQADFTTGTAATTQTGLNAPQQLDYDVNTNRLYAADYSNNRVVVYDVAAIADNEAQISVLGQGDFTTSAAANS